MRHIGRPSEGTAKGGRTPRFAAIGASLLVGLALLPGTVAASDGVASGACFEADSSAFDASAWGDVLRAITETAEGEPDFFPAPIIASLPDLTQLWVPEEAPTIKIGVWGTDDNHPAPDIDPRSSLAGAECLAKGSAWTTTISYELLVAGAERILAGARLPDESGEPPIREDAEAAIHVEFHPAEARVRTTLDFNVPIGPFRPGGTCWIDDVLSVDPETGMAISNASKGEDVDWIVRSGCDKFQAFMTEGGAGEQALTLLPTEVLLGDGTTARFIVASIVVDEDVIVMSGAIDHD